MTFCFRCMAQISENDSTCPHCGKKPVAGVPVYHLLPGTILNGRYMVGMALGEGGFGITYLGLDLMLNMKVAIKEYYPTGYVNRSNTVSSEVTCMTEGTRLDFSKKERKDF